MPKKELHYLNSIPIPDSGNGSNPESNADDELIITTFISSHLHPL